MINPEFAQNFIMRIHRQLKIQVNIMNEKGVIIASSTPERIGSFHILAYEIIEGRQSMRVTDSMEMEDHTLIGVSKPGVNMLLTDGIEIIGVVGVSGSPQDVLPYAKMLKFTFEELWEQEKKRLTAIKDQGWDSKLLDALIFETPMNHARIFKLSKQMRFREEECRIPVYMHFIGSDLEQIAGRLQSNIRTSPFYSTQDLLLKMDAQHYFLAKSFKEAQFPHYKDYFLEYWKDLMGKETELLEECQIRCVVGLPQKSLLHYRKMMDMMIWIGNEAKIMGDNVLFAGDYVLDYTANQANEASLTPIFELSAQQILSEMDWEVFSQTMEALIQSNLRLQESANRLFMHKNTIQIRVEKIKRGLGINPLKSPKDAIFLIMLYHFMKKRT